MRFRLLPSIPLLLCLLCALAPARAGASDDPATGDATGRYEERRWRAGCPDLVAPYARCGYSSRYCGLYVGGGAPISARRFRCGGESRFCHEGTFGVDYAPWYSRVNLAWYHGRKHQGGEGQYEPNRTNSAFPNLVRR